MFNLLSPMETAAPFGSAAGFAADLAVGLDAALTGLCATQVVAPMPMMDAPVLVDDVLDYVGWQLLEAADAAGADMLVVGAYGHRRFNEWLLGGMTRHVLEHARIPLFMRH